MPYPMYTSTPTQVCQQTLHSETQFGMPCYSTAASGAGDAYRPSSSGSGVSVRPAGKTRGNRFNLTKVFAGIRKVFCTTKPKTQRPITPIVISSPFGATTGDGRPLDASCLAQLGVRHSPSGFFVPAMMESSPLGNRRVCRASVRCSGVSKSKPSMRSRRSVRVSAHRQSRMTEMASREIGLSSSPAPTSRRARCDSIDSAAGRFSYRVTNHSDSGSVIDVVTYADARGRSIVVDDAAAVANDVHAATNSVAAAADAAWQYDFEIPDVAASNTLPNACESYDAFKARYAAACSAAPPSLAFIPRFPSLTMDTAVDLAPAPLSPAHTPEAVAQHRDQALASLEGYGPAPATIPPSLRLQAYPTSLMPGQQYTDAEGNVRASMDFYQPRSSTPCVEGPDSYNAVRNARRSQGKYESHGQTGVYYNVPRGPRARTPMSFASSEQHAEHYSRVESGVYEIPSSSPPQQPTYTAYSPGANARGSPGAPAIKRKPAKITKSRDGKKTTTAVYTRQSVPAAPARGTVPSHHRMNDNGYPVADLGAAEARYSAAPIYQTRTVDRVEAKFQRETGKAAAIAVPAPSKKVKKGVEKVAKKEAKRQRQAQDAARIERAVGQLLG